MDFETQSFCRKALCPFTCPVAKLTSSIARKQKFSPLEPKHVTGVELDIINSVLCQVADVMVYRMECHGDWPCYVHGLAATLLNHIPDYPSERLYIQRNREQVATVAMVTMITLKDVKPHFPSKTEIADIFLGSS